MLASTVPTCEAYDPAFAYETAEIVRHGIGDMYGEAPRDVFYYLTIYNENDPQPPMPDGVADGIIEGLYRWSPGPEVDNPHVSEPLRATVLFSGSAQRAARQAQTELAERWGVTAELWSVTSYKRLREEACEVERWNRLHPTADPRVPRVTELLASSEGPIVAVTDFMRAVPDQISRWIPVDRRYTSLGTDGFGRSDTREALRRYFETDMAHLVLAVLHELANSGRIGREVVSEAIDHYQLDPEADVPWHG